MPGFCHFKLDTWNKTTCPWSLFTFQVKDTNYESTPWSQDQAVLLGIILYFFGLRRHKFTKKFNLESSKFFRLSKYEKHQVSPILDSLKFHSKGPVLLQTGTDHSFLGFESKTKLDSSEGWAYKQAYVILLKLVKNKEVLARNGGGKMRRMSLFDIFLSQEKPYYRSWTRHLFIHLGWEILYLTVDQNHLTSLAGLWESTLSHSSPNHLLCRYVFKRSVNKTFNRKIPIIHCVIIESVLAATFLQLELWFRVVGLPATGRFLSRSAHYLESWLRNRQYLGVCMHQWQVSRLRRQFHHWLAIEGFREMFDIDSFIHISWIVLGTLRTIDITGGLSHAC